MKQVLCLLVGLSVISVVLSLPKPLKTKPVKNIPSQCVDPTFACQDIENARLCGVVKSCIHDVWATMNAPDDNDTVCDICKEMVKEARDQLLSNMTQEEIKEVFEGSCKLLPVKIIADSCIKLVDQFIPELVEMLSSRMDPNMVCTVCGLCNLVHLPIEKKNNHVGDDLTCEFCDSVLEHIKEMIIANSTEEEFRTALLNFCKHVGSFSDKCTEYVNDYFDMLYDFIRKLDTKEFCTIIGLCQNGLSSNATPLVKIFPAETFRKHTSLVKLLPSLPIKEKVSSRPLVKIIPSSLISKKARTSSLETDTNDIFENPASIQLPLERLSHPWITLDENLECPFCKAISFYLKTDLNGDRSQNGVEQALSNVCDKWVKEYPDHCASFIKKYSEELLLKITEGEDLDSVCITVKACPLEEKDISGVNVRVVSPTNDSIICDLCKNVFNEVENVLKDPQTKARIEDALGNLCNLCTQEEKCKNLVNTHIDIVLSKIEQILEGDKICPALHLCPAGHGIAAKSSFKGVECDLCKDLVQELIDELQNQQVQDSVKQFMVKGCSFLPQELAAECKTFVNKNFDAIIQLVIGTLNPDVSCASMNICPESKKVVIPKVKDMQCDLCKEVIQALENEIKDQRTEEQIKAALDKVCSYLPSSLATQCKTLVDTYTETIITLLMVELDPDTVCAAFKVCTESHKIELPKFKDLECDICKEVVQNLENDIKDQKTEEKIKEALEKVCSYLPSSLSSQCKTFIDTYTETIITLLLQEIDPNTICAALKVCTESNKIELPKVKDLECDLCKEVFQNLENELKDPKTVEEIKAALEKVCSYLPSSLTSECKTFVDTYTQTIITLLLAEIDPDTICAALKVCTESKKEVKIPKLKDMECDLCKEIVEMVEKDLKDKKTEDAIRDALEKVCSYLPSTLSARCKTFVDTYIETLITLIAEESDPSMVCAALKACPSKPELYWKWQSKAQDLKCEGCQDFLHFIQNQLVDNTTQAELKNVLKKVCGLLPKSFTENCFAFLDEYGSSLLVLVAQEIDPSLICPKFGLCPSTTKGLTKSSQLETKSLHIDECQICTTVVDYIDQLLEEDDIDKELTNIVEKVCTVVPVSVKDRCSSVIETYGPYILQMIGQIANSKMLCQDIDLCERPAGHVHLLGGMKCTFGPSYWCRSKAHATACKAEAYCSMKI